MLRTDQEYKIALNRRKDQHDLIMQQKEILNSKGFSESEIETCLESIRAFHSGLCEEIFEYEKTLRGEFAEINNLQNIGKYLISFRLFKQISQRELANRLNVSETQISRDERNEYNGITCERASKVLDALGVTLESSVCDPLQKGVTSNFTIPEGISNNNIEQASVQAQNSTCKVIPVDFGQAKIQSVKSKTNIIPESPRRKASN